ncbi:hypothetical protein [Anabaena catenula]|uniref:Transposase n=1 Tax=Anabaena catenula FACHB-362 TaxID=2692877 RepID=A0ABR8J7U1_9NOST|nr:hypothetical protein [Anabaena catenula]MBD2693633.1 hypothetical protein [Anabaena catenula FACHB-362]
MLQQSNKERFLAASLQLAKNLIINIQLFKQFIQWTPPRIEKKAELCPWSLILAFFGFAEKFLNSSG